MAGDGEQQCGRDLFRPVAVQVEIDLEALEAAIGVDQGDEVLNIDHVEAAVVVVGQDQFLEGDKYAKVGYFFHVLCIDRWGSDPRLVSEKSVDFLV